MSLSERIKALRKTCGFSQEKVADRLGVSRQAVAKWESGQSAPSTENLFKLAELFGTTVDFLLSDEPVLAPDETPPLRQPEPPERLTRSVLLRRNTRAALLTLSGYLAIYLLGRIFWCDLSQSSILGWLFTVRPSGEYSYLYGWLLSSHLFWYAAAISALPALFGKRRFTLTTLAAFVLGLVLGMVFGPNPAGAATGHTHNGWLIWGAVYLLSIPAGLFLEKRLTLRPRRDGFSPPPSQG